MMQVWIPFFLLLLCLLIYEIYNYHYSSTPQESPGRLEWFLQCSPPGNCVLSSVCPMNAFLSTGRRASFRSNNSASIYRRSCKAGFNVACLFTPTSSHWNYSLWSSEPSPAIFLAYVSCFLYHSEWPQLIVSYRWRICVRSQTPLLVVSAGTFLCFILSTLLFFFFFFYLFSPHSFSNSC